MAFPAAFAILLAYTVSSIGHPQGMPFWAVATQPRSRRVTILMRTDRPKFSTTCWCTQPGTTTAIFCQTSPCKHVRFKYQPPPPTSIAHPIAQPIAMPLLTNVKVASLYVHQGSLNSLASDLATHHQDLESHLPAMLTRATPSLSTAGLFSSGLSSLTSPVVERASALNASRYSSVPHNHLPENEVDDSPGHDMFSMAHRTVLDDSSGHFWFLQVGIKYLPDQDSKTTMLLGLSALMDILLGETHAL
jgi:hypothetical protein